MFFHCDLCFLELSLSDVLSVRNKKLRNWRVHEEARERKEVLALSSFSSSANFLMDKELSAVLLGSWGEYCKNSSWSFLSVSYTFSSVKREGRVSESFRVHLTPSWSSWECLASQGPGFFMSIKKSDVSLCMHLDGRVQASQHVYDCLCLYSKMSEMFFSLNRSLVIQHYLPCCARIIRADLNWFPSMFSTKKLMYFWTEPYSKKCWVWAMDFR